MGSALIRIAFRNVSRNRRRSLITISAIFVALAVMTSIRGFLNGLQATVREAVVLGQTGSLQVHRKGFLKAVLSSPLSMDMPADPAFLAQITAVPGVKAAAARISFGGMANANDTTAFAQFTAVDPQNETRVCPRRLDAISSGTTLAATGGAQGILTPELAAKLSVKTGQKVTIISNDKDGVLNGFEFDFVGVYGQPGLPMPEKQFGFVPLGLAQDLLRINGRATEIAIAIEHGDDADSLRAPIQAAVGPQYEVSTWHDVAPFVDDVIGRQNFVLNLIAAIFLFVALLGITNTMLMSVLERTREIGTMMSVGVTRRKILTLFLIEAGLLGLCGGILGIASGWGLVLYLGHKGMQWHFVGMAEPIYVYPHLGGHYVLLVLSVAAGGATLAALWPSLRASRLRPVEALASV